MRFFRDVFVFGHKWLHEEISDWNKFWLEGNDYDGDKQGEEKEDDNNTLDPFIRVIYFF